MAKVYDIRVEHRPISFLVENPKRVVFCGIPCIRGRNRIWRDSVWGPGVNIYIEITQIRQIYEFDSFDAYLRELERFTTANASAQTTLTAEAKLRN